MNTIAWTERPWAAPKKHPLAASPLRVLSLDLLLYLASRMDTTTAALFTLACKPLYFTLGTSYLAAISAAPVVCAPAGVDSCSISHPDSPCRSCFLKLLSENNNNNDDTLPDHILCPPCGFLHPIASPARFLHPIASPARFLHSAPYLKEGESSIDADARARPEARMPCWRADRDLQTGKYVHEEISFVLVQMAMKRYRQTKPAVEILELLSDKAAT
jgi:hypothetical protein